MSIDCKDCNKHFELSYSEIIGIEYIVFDLNQDIKIFYGQNHIEVYRISSKKGQNYLVK